MSLIHCIKNNYKPCYLRRLPVRQAGMHYLMGTFLSIEVFGLETIKTAKAVELAFSEVRHIEKKISRFREDSQVSMINKSASLQPRAIDNELFCLFEDCLGVSQQSNGAFDITAAPLLDLWARAEKADMLPSDDEIRALLHHIGYQNILLDEEKNTIFFKTAFLKIDLGAVGKGYALDRAVEVLKDNQISKARLDFGGQLYYFDQAESKEEYIGIRNPLEPDRIILSLQFNNKSISTSAHYERNIHINNKIHSHIINPINGYPVNNDILSVSVTSSSALLADIYSTTLYILGIEKGLMLIENMNDIEAVIISNDYGKPKINISPKLEGRCYQIYDDTY